MTRRLMIFFTLAVASLTALAANEAAIMAALTDARTMKTTEDGFQFVTHNGQMIRAVRTMDGGYSIFGTNGSSRVFPTPMGYVYRGPSNDNRTVSLGPRGFTITGGPSGTVSVVNAGSGWVGQGTTNQVRATMNYDGWTTVGSASTAMSADKVYEQFLQREQGIQTPVPARPEPAPVAPPQPFKFTNKFDK